MSRFGHNYVSFGAILCVLFHRRLKDVYVFCVNEREDRIGSDLIGFTPFLDIDKNVLETVLCNGCSSRRAAAAA